MLCWRRKIRNEGFVDAERRKDVSGQRGGVFLQVVVEIDVNLIRVEKLVVARQLLVIKALRAKMIERAPTVLDTLRLVTQRRREVGMDLFAVAYEMEKCGKGAVYGVSQDGDDGGVGNITVDSGRHVGKVQVLRRRLAARAFVPGVLEKSLIHLERSYVAGTLAPTLRAVFSGDRPLFYLKKFRLFDGRHVDVGMLFEIVVQRRGSGFGRADNDEVGHGGGGAWCKGRAMKRCVHRSLRLAQHG